MARYNFKEVAEILNATRKEIANPSYYTDFLKTLGNNYKYTYAHQLSIYSCLLYTSDAADDAAIV